VSLLVVVVAGQDVIGGSRGIGQAAAAWRQRAVVVGHGELGNRLDSWHLYGERTGSRSLEKATAGVRGIGVGGGPALLLHGGSSAHDSAAIATLCNVGRAPEESVE
jgi:hypothetical protein